MASTNTDDDTADCSRLERDADFCTCSAAALAASTKGVESTDYDDEEE